MKLPITLSTVAIFSSCLMGFTVRSAYSATIFYSDFASFDLATDTALVEDFETFPSTGVILPSFTSNGNTYTGLTGNPFPNVIVVSTSNPNFSFPLSSSVLTANGDEDFTVDFGSPQKALGFDTYLNSDGPATVSVFGSSGLLDTFIHSHDPTTVGFLGIAAAEAITSIQWTTVNGRVINTGIDNIRQGEPTSVEHTSVPEPFSVLGLFAVGSLIAMKRRSFQPTTQSQL